MSGKEIPVYGSGMNIRDWIYVEDHCSGIDAVITKGRMGETYLIGARNERTNLEVIKLILSKLRKSESLIEFVEDRKGHDYRYSLDPSKIERELGWSPSHPFDKAIAETIDFYRKNSIWKTSKSRPNEFTFVMKALPPCLLFLDGSVAV